MENTIYAICDPINDEVIYIGNTFSLRHRMYFHLNKNTQKTLSTPISKWLYDILNKGIKPKIKTIEICSKEDSYDREKYWIRQHKENGCMLLNVALGGKGASGVSKVMSEESKNKIRLKKKGAFQKGKTIVFTDFNGIPIKIFESLTDASNYSGCSINSISNNLKKLSQKTKSGIWEYF